MAKKQAKGGDIRYAVNKAALKKARAQAAQTQAQQEKRAENREKSRRMGSVFLLSVLSLIALFCLYTLIRTLCFPRAASLEALRNNLLFVSVAAIPFLLGFGAVLVHRLLKKRRESWSDRSKRLGTLLLVLCVTAAFLLFGIQLRNSRRDASADPVYAKTLAALEQSGLPVTEPERVDAVRTLLEDSLQTELRCGETWLRLHFHAAGSSWVLKRFLDQAAWDYEKYPLREEGALKIWGPMDNGLPRAALALSRDGTIRVIELFGPRSEIETLLPLLTASLDS